jgi:phosphatidylglycerophosphatase C
MQPEGGKPRRIAIFDLDGTLTRRDTFLPFVTGLLLRHPARWPRALLLPVLMAGYLAGRLDRGGLKGSILRLLFAGMPRPLVSDHAARFAAAAVRDRMHQQGVEALRHHLREGDQVVILSASPDLYVPAIARLLGAHQAVCSEVRWNGEHLDGRLSGPNRRDHEKARVLQGLRAAHPGLPAIAYGNSDPDLVHMQQCEEAVFVNAPPEQARRLSGLGIRCVDWR